MPLYLPHFDLQNYNTLASPVYADFFVSVKNNNELLDAIKFGKEKSLPLLILGGGSLGSSNFGTDYTGAWTSTTVLTITIGSNTDGIHLIPGTTTVGVRSGSGLKDVGEGIAALYSYESQIPPICISKIDGLKKHYGMKDPKGWEYFSVHIGADEQHSRDERKLLEQYVTAENGVAIKAAANKVLDVLWNFLSGLSHRYGLCSNVA